MKAETQYDRATRAANFIREQYKSELEVGIVLGSGLGAFADEIEECVKIPYAEIPHFARSTVEGHAGRLVLGKVEGINVVAMQGRFHYYEGYSMEEVTFPHRVMGLLGIKSLILTNAAGGINVDFEPGMLMLICDHLNLLGTNPLIGRNDERFGARFPDMTFVYDRDYQELVIQEAKTLGIKMRRGVYAALTGPSYETPAEIRLFRIFGADAVGMSTVPEAIVARQMGIKVIGISCITNLAAGVTDEPINHAEVMETGNRVKETFKELLRRVIPKL